MSGQEKRQRAESFLAKKILNPLTTHPLPKYSTFSQQVYSVSVYYGIF